MARAVLAAIALALAAVPVAAQDAMEPEPYGVWQGTIGDVPVHACIGERSLYYYDRYLSLIRLVPEDGMFREQIGWDKPGDAIWQITSVTGDAAEGLWQTAERELPIRLTRIAWDPINEYSQPCEADAFMLPRMAGGQIVSEPVEIRQIAVTRLTYVAAPHWQTATDGRIGPIGIASFALDPVQAGDSAINRILAQYLPAGDPRDDFAQCLVASFAFSGVDGDFSQYAEPEVLTTRWLGMIESNSNYCGGAHPYHWQTRRVFDRSTGREVDPQSWLSDRALARELYAAGADSFVFVTLTEEFRQSIIGFWPSGSDAECRDLAFDTADWDIGLTAGGLGFIPRVPHAATVCAETVTVPWDALLPYLSLEGQAARIAAEAG